MTDLRLDIALKQIEFARQYSLSLLEDLEPDEWFRAPAGLPTHAAWQLGHLAMAEYGLALFRQRGRRSEDTRLMSSSFRKRFSRGSVPSLEAADYPGVEEIRGVLDRVHQQVLVELPDYSSEQLDEPVEMPYAGYPTKFGALLFCASHEMLHAGQIGLLRRGLGKPPVR